MMMSVRLLWSENDIRGESNTHKPVQGTVTGNCNETVICGNEISNNNNGGGETVNNSANVANGGRWQ
jgi:hypothetical protein